MCIESSWNICLLFGEMPPRPFEGNLRYLRLLLLETVKCNDTQSARDIFATLVEVVVKGEAKTSLVRKNCQIQEKMGNRTLTHLAFLTIMQKN